MQAYCARVVGESGDHGVNNTLQCNSNDDRACKLQATLNLLVLYSVEFDREESEVSGQKSAKCEDSESLSLHVRYSPLS